jgi:hypothetical protein
LFESHIGAPSTANAIAFLFPRMSNLTQDAKFGRSEAFGQFFMIELTNTLDEEHR